MRFIQYYPQIGRQHGQCRKITRFAFYAYVGEKDVMIGDDEIRLRGFTACLGDKTGLGGGTPQTGTGIGL